MRPPFNKVDLRLFKLYPLPKIIIFKYLVLIIEVAVIGEATHASEETWIGRNSW